MSKAYDLSAEIKKVKVLGKTTKDFLTELRKEIDAIRKEIVKP